MAMNRQTRRLLQKQGEVDADGAPVRTRRPPTTPRPKEERTSPVQFLREVRAELRKVAWPTREELLNYSIVVLVTIVVLTSIIAGLDFLAGQGVLELFDV